MNSTTKKGFFDRLCYFIGAGTVFPLGALKPFVTQLMLKRVKNQVQLVTGVLQLFRLVQVTPLSLGLSCLPLTMAKGAVVWLLCAPVGAFSPLFHFEGLSSPFPSILGHIDEVSSGNFLPPLGGEEEAGWKGRSEQLSFRFPINAAP